MSYTILPYSVPYTQEAQYALNMQGVFLAQTNSFLVPQNFAGIVNSGSDDCASLAVSGNASIVGSLNAGATTVSSLVISGAESADSLTVSNASVFNGPISGTSAVLSGAFSAGTSNVSSLIIAGQLLVQGVVDLPVGSINQSEVLGGYCDLLNDQSVSGIKTFSSPPVLSGASIGVSSIPALSIVSDSITDIQIAPSGISQSSIASGYVDLINNQVVGGEKTFGYSRFAAGLWAIGTTTLQDTTTTNLSANRLVVGGPVIANGLNSRVTCDGPVTSNVSMTAPTFNGALVGNASTCSIASNIIVRTDNSTGSFAIPFIKTSDGNDSIYVDDVATPFMTYRPSDGVLSTAGLTISGVSNLAQVVLPVAQTALAIVSGSVAVNLNNCSFNEFSLSMTASIQTFTFSNAIVNSSFNIYLVNSSGSNKTMSKALSSGTVACINTLGGNTSIANNAVYLIRGKVLSPSLVLLQFISAS